MAKQHKSASKAQQQHSSRETPIPKRKTFDDAFHDSLRVVSPLTPTQEKFTKAFRGGNNIIGIGAAGTGKTYLSLGLALGDVLMEKRHHQIIIVRSAVETRKIGFRPGTEEEKMGDYEKPYKAIVHSLFNNPMAYERLKYCRKIVFEGTSTIRGVTWDNAVVIVDEAQNLNFHELDSVITRVGENTQLVIVGDTFQSDLLMNANDATGLPELCYIAKSMPAFATMEFGVEDIVRSAFVRDWIIAVREHKINGTKLKIAA